MVQQDLACSLRRAARHAFAQWMLLAVSDSGYLVGSDFR